MEDHVKKVSNDLIWLKGRESVIIMDRDEICRELFSLADIDKDGIIWRYVECWYTVIIPKKIIELGPWTPLISALKNISTNYFSSLSTKHKFVLRWWFVFQLTHLLWNTGRQTNLIKETVTLQKERNIWHNRYLEFRTLYSHITNVMAYPIRKKTLLNPRRSKKSQITNGQSAFS